MKQPRFEVYESKDGWRWRLVAANGRILASGESHTRKADAERAVATVTKTIRAMPPKIMIKRNTMRIVLHD
jgi:uncharacterized protein YegP (UPF0339 family)